MIATITAVLAAIYRGAVKNWKIVLPALVGLALFIYIVGLVRSCGQPSLIKDERQIQKAQKALAEDDRQRMTEVLRDSDLKEANIDQARYKAQEETIRVTQESTQKYSNMDNEQLRAELERRLNP